MKKSKVTMRSLSRQSAAIFSVLLMAFVLLLSGSLITSQEEASEVVMESPSFKQRPVIPKEVRSRRKVATPSRRVVHLDLKGAPPKVAYFRELFPVVKAAGATSLLIEYEDTFPYSGALEPISATNRYSAGDVRSILDLALESGLEVTPLVQTFGHMEHVLKLQQFAHLREDLYFPESVCPSKNESVHLVKMMIDQMMAAHANHSAFSGAIHVGCDEVFHLAQCSECTSRLRRLNSAVSKGAAGARGGRHLFLEHVKTVAKHVRSVHGATPLVWDDMFRSIPSWELLDSGVGDLVEPVVWVYGETVDAFVGGHVWHKYAAAFGGRLWAASAFKGAFGEQLLLPVAHRHLKNNLEWTETMWREGRASGSGNGRHRAGFRGLVLTGWSRYDHFAVLCELLPAAIPSLVANLVTVAHPHSQRDREAAFRGAISCPNGTDAQRVTSVLMRDDTKRFHDLASGCSFPGDAVFRVVLELSRLKSSLSKMEEKEGKVGGWTTDYNVRHNFTSTWRMREPVGLIRKALDALATLEAKAREALGKIYDEYSVSEWIEQNMLSLRESLEGKASAMESMMSRKIWSRRPLTN